MQTQDFLRQEGLAALGAQYKISARRHGTFPNLVLLKYSQIESPMAEPIVQQCRGLIVDEADDWRIVSRAYDKFFNHGEPNAANIDWTTARVEEKLDGSLMMLYHYGNEWRVSSSGLPDAAGMVESSGISFADLFWQTFKQLGYALPDAAPDLCFAFELMTPLNRIVVQHAQSRLVLHGVRDRVTHEELEAAPIASRFGWECVQSFPLTNVEACLAAACALDPLRAEGYVVRDANMRRVKIKCPQYVALTHLKDAMNGRRLLEIIRANESAEFLTYFPQFTGAYERVRREFDSLCEALEADYVRLRDIPDQRAFAAEAVKTRCSSPLFSLRKGSCTTVREHFAGSTIQSLERAIGIDLATLIAPAADEAPSPTRP